MHAVRQIIWSLVTQILFLLGPAAAAQSPAVYGIIQTTTDQRLEGSIRFDNDALHVTDDRDQRHVVPLSKLSSFVPAEPRPASAEHEDAPTHGLSGSYFQTRELTGSSWSRLDETIDFDWGNGAPFPDFHSEGFSARWEGSVLAPSAGAYRFHVFSDDGVRLWIDGQLILDQWRDRSVSESSGEAILEEGKKHDLKLEYYENAGQATVRLLWTVPGHVMEVIPKDRLFPGRVPEAQTSQPPPVTSQPPGVWLSDGSFLARTVFSVNGSSIRFSRSANEPEVALTYAARIHFQEVPKDQVKELDSGRPGLLLKTGDFLDGEMKKFENGSVELSSVLLGLRTIRSNQILAAVFRKVISQEARFEIRTMNRSFYRVNQLQLTGNRLLFLDPPLRGFTENADQLVEIRKMP